jgi:hypothetical protein
MRLDLPDGAWIELRGPGELTGADDDAWQAVYAEVWASAAEADANHGLGEGGDAAAAEATASRHKRIVRVPPDFLQRQRDALLGELVTGWSYDVPLPYTAAARKRLPLAACRALNAAIQPHIEILKVSGPAEEPPVITAADTSADGAGAPQRPPGQLAPAESSD